MAKCEMVLKKSGRLPIVWQKCKTYWYSFS